MCKRTAVQRPTSAPFVIGKKDEKGEDLFPAYGTLEPQPDRHSPSPRARILERKQWPESQAGLADDRGAGRRAAGWPGPRGAHALFLRRLPAQFIHRRCPKAARGYAGIGCHWMVQGIPERHTQGSTQMGGEGANWIGEAPFSKRKPRVPESRRRHLQSFGPARHPRRAWRPGVNITYKILYNDAVAMTGGQANDGPLSRADDRPADARRRRRAHRHRLRRARQSIDASVRFPSGATFHHRDDIMRSRASSWRCRAYRS